MKMIDVWRLCALLCVCALLMTGCGRTAAEPENSPEPEPSGENTTAPVLGGWTATEDFSLTEEAMTVFQKATEGFTGVDYDPTALLATQPVSGINRAYFCRARVVAPDARPYFAIVYVYESLDGNAQITGIESVTPGGQFDENAGGAEALAGGWSVPENDGEAIAAFESAAEKLLGVNFVPVTVMGQQVVSGMNYCLLCRAETVTPDARPYYCFVHVYRDLQGNAEVTDVTELSGQKTA